MTTSFAPCQGADCRWAHSSNPLPWGHSIGDLYVFVTSKIRDTETKGVSGSCRNDASLVPKCTADQKLLEGRCGQRVGPRTAQVSQLVSGKVCGSKRCGSNSAQLREKMWGNMFGYILNVATESTKHSWMLSSPKLGVSFATWLGGLQMIAPCQVGLLETLYACMLCCLSKHLGFVQGNFCGLK